jgi:hypothetical protein
VKSEISLLTIFAIMLVTGTVAPRIVSADVELGVLSCKSVAGSRLNLVIRSTVDVKCEMKYSGGEVERYKGETGIVLGLALSFKDDEEIVFTVISVSEVKAGSYPVAGKYIGGKATVSAGVGLGAAALIGGSDDNFGLNPLALESNRGVGVAAGIGFLYIEPDR